MTLQPIPSELPYEENFFYQYVLGNKLAGISSRNTEAQTKSQKEHLLGLAHAMLFLD
jgi:hypothetical protein